MGRKIYYLGLDCETSTDSLAGGGKLIQIGLAHFCSDANVASLSLTIRQPESEMAWDEEAAAVHKITKEEVVSAKSAAEVDQLCVDFVNEHFDLADNHKLIPVGFDVGAFDMPFVRATLPMLSKLFGRQSLDLNSICFGFSIARADSLDDTGDEMQHWKRSSIDCAHKKLAEDSYSTREGWWEHNAGYDAAEGLLALKYLVENM